MDEQIIGILESGSVEYSAQAAAVDISDLIAALEAARDDEGVTHVALDSGNHRGAQYMRLFDHVMVD